LLTQALAALQPAVNAIQQTAANVVANASSALSPAAVNSVVTNILGLAGSL